MSLCGDYAMLFIINKDALEIFLIHDIHEQLQDFFLVLVRSIIVSCHPR